MTTSNKIQGIAGFVLAALLLAASATAATTLSAAMKNAPANSWAKVADEPGPRRSFALVYAPGEGAFVALGGNLPTGFASEMTLNLERGRWENRFPGGKQGVWGDMVGPAKMPDFAHGVVFTDLEGNVRPKLDAGYYNGMWTWENFALDSDRGKVVVYWTMLSQTTEYDPAARSWRVTTTPADHAQKFRDGMLFGAMCYDPVNGEVIGCQGGWAYADGKWRKLEFGSAVVIGLRAKADALRIRARNLAGACRARYYLAESEDEGRVALDQVAAALQRDVKSLADEIARADARGHESAQLRWAAESLAAAGVSLNAAGGSLGRKVTAAGIHLIDAAREELAGAVEALAVQPPPRAHARMVYDAKNRKIVLFGGDALDRLLGDTWVYDCATRAWSSAGRRYRRRRAGYRMAYLPRSGKVLLIDGYGYKGAGEMWTYDSAADRWQPLAEAGELKRAAARKDWYPLPAAASDDDLVVSCFRSGDALATYAAKIDPSRVDEQAATRRGAAPMTRRADPADTEDPQWFENAAPAADPGAEEEWFGKLPANQWTMRKSPNWPNVEYGRSRCWGSCTLDTDRDQLLHFGGGHATYDGNEVLHYSIRANRYYIGHRPEHTLNFAPNGIGIPMCASYQGRPLTSCHSYKCYAYDPPLRRLVLCAQKDGGSLFTYDPGPGDWSADLTTLFHGSAFDIKLYQTKCIATPGGAIAWTETGEGLWRVDAKGGTWRKLPVQGKIIAPGWDTEGMAYDSKRDRLLMFSSAFKGDVTVCDLKRGEVSIAHPAGRENAGGNCREAVYLPECDGVLLATQAQAGDGKARWLFYDCAKDAWLGVQLGGADVIGKERFNPSVGLMYDPKRKLVWAMDMLSRPYAVRLDMAKADVVALDGAATREAR